MEPKPPSRQPAIRTIMMPKDTNAYGSIFGGVILSLIDLAAAVEGKRPSEAGLITHQLTASAALCRAQSLESALRELGRLCSEGFDPARTADAWCKLESAITEFFAGGDR